MAAPSRPRARLAHELRADPAAPVLRENVHLFEVRQVAREQLHQREADRSVSVERNPESALRLRFAELDSRRRPRSSTGIGRMTPKQLRRRELDRAQHRDVPGRAATIE